MIWGEGWGLWTAALPSMISWIISETGTEKKTEKGLGVGRRKGIEKGRKRVEETIEGAFWREKKRCGILRRNKKKID